MPPKCFSDFAEEDAQLDGDKVKISSILNQKILIVGCKIKKSKYAKQGSDQYLTVQFERDGKKNIFFTGSNVLIDQIKKYEHEIPFVATVKKIDRYYIFS